MYMLQLLINCFSIYFFHSNINPILKVYWSFRRRPCVLDLANKKVEVITKLTNIEQSVLFTYLLKGKQSVVLSNNSKGNCTL